MRILSYNNEKKTFCPKCNTKLAYSIDHDVYEIKEIEGVDSVQNVLKWFKKEKGLLNQLTQTQLSKMIEHQDWVCVLCTTTRYIICPICKEKIYLTDKIDYIEIYPKNTVDDESGELTCSYYQWDESDFNKIKD